MEDNMLKILNKLGAFKTGHFLLPSGKHSGVYFQCANLLKLPVMTESILKVLVDQIKCSKLSFDIILGPAMGGVIVAYELARQLNKSVIYIERKNGNMILSEGFRVPKGKKILIAEDVITSGKTIRESIKLVENLGGIIVGVTCIINKENIKIEQNIYSYMTCNFISYEKDECPFCRESLPLQNGK